MRMDVFNKKAAVKYKTVDNTYADFTVGTKVEVICGCRDFTFFADRTPGVIVENNGGYLGLIVMFKDGSTHNFKPIDLRIVKKVKCKCGCHRYEKK